MMSAFGGSRTGWTLVVAYLVFVALLFGQALTCTGWLCDLVALPVALPLGLPVAWLIDWIDWMHPIPGHVPSVHFGSVYFILPTVTANAVLHFLAGHLVEASVRRWRRRRACSCGRSRSPTRRSCTRRSSSRSGRCARTSGSCRGSPRTRRSSPPRRAAARRRETSSCAWICPTSPSSGGRAAWSLDGLGAKRVELVTDELNVGSRAVARRCGIRLEGVLRHAARSPDGRLRNTCLYARLPGEG